MGKLVNRAALRWIVVALVASLTLMTTACGIRNEAEPAKQTGPAQSAREIRIGYLNVMDDAQVLLAYDGGFYEQQGLKVELKQFSSGTDLIKAIVGGQVDAGVLGFTNALTWSSKGADLKVVGGAQLGFHSILVKNDSGIKSVAELKGKRLASQKPGSTADVVLTGVILPKAGLSVQDLKMSYVEPAAAIQALNAGAVDAAFVFEPYDQIAQKRFKAQRIYEIGKEWPFPCMVVITSGDVLKKDRELITRMLDAQKSAIDLLQQDSKKAASLIAKRFIEGDTLDTPQGKIAAVDVIKDAIDSQVFNWEITPDQIKRMQELADIMQQQGTLNTTVKVDDILDLSWQKSVQQ